MSDNMRDLGNAGLGPERIGDTAQRMIRQIEAVRESAPPSEPTLEPDPLRQRIDEWSKKVWPRFATATTRDFVPAVNDRVHHAIGAQRSIVIVGSVGVGKTHLAVGAAQYAYMRGDSVYMTPVVDLLDALRPDGVGAPFEPCGPRWLLLDDMGAEKTTDWTLERLYMIVNQRWLHNMPIIATTNLSRPDLEAAVGARTASRLMDDAVVILLEGGDRRA